MKIKRKLFQRLKSWKNLETRKPLILQGIRQVGKTSLLQEFGRREFKKTHYINFEKDPGLKGLFEQGLAPKFIIEQISIKTNSVITPGEDLLIFDEVQNIPLALTSLKYFNEELPEQHVVAAGSLLGVLLAGLYGESFSFPVGKVDFMTLYPLSFEEFLGAGENQQLFKAYLEIRAGVPVPEIVHEMLWEQWKIFLILGGMPEAVATYYGFSNSEGDSSGSFIGKVTACRNMQDDLIRAYEADIAKHSGKANAMHVIRLLHATPHKLAKTDDSSSQKFTFKDVIPGVRGYTRMANAIDWLTHCGLIYKLHLVETPQIPLSAFYKENSFKLYLADVGLLGALSGIPSQVYMDFNFSMYKGYVAENFVLQELITSQNQPIACWARNTSEVEFILERGGELIPLEVKSGNKTRAKSLGVYLNKYKPKYALKLTARAGQVYVDSGVKIVEVPLYMAGRVFDIL